LRELLLGGMPADVLFILIGGEPVSRRVADWLRLDENGFYLTGSDLVADQGPGPQWPLKRQPMPLESSQPGVFVMATRDMGPSSESHPPSAKARWPCSSFIATSRRATNHASSVEE